MILFLSLNVFLYKIYPERERERERERGREEYFLTFRFTLCETSRKMPCSISIIKEYLGS